MGSSATVRLRRFLSIGFLLLLGSVFLLPVSSAQAVDDGSISGTVTNTSGAPLVGICAYAQNSGGYQGDVNVTTDAGGHYTVGDLATGDYAVRFVNCGHNSAIDEYYNDKSTFATANLVTATAGADTPNINAQLVTIVGEITGTVTNSSGTPLNGICVDLYDSGEGRSLDATNANGVYSFIGLAPGDYRLFFYNCTTYNVANEYYSDKSDLATANTISLVEGEVKSNIDAQLATGGTIAGIVTDTSGTPLDGACVWTFTASGDEFKRVFTNSIGKYSVNGLATGNYRIEFGDCGHGDFTTEFYNDKPSLATANQIAVTAGAVTSNINAQLAPTGFIEGRVVSNLGASLDGICVRAIDSEGETARNGETDNSGSYRLDRLSAGDYRLRFYNCGSPLNLIGEYYDNKSSLADANPVTVVAGAVTADIDVQMETGGAITGKITDSSGEAIANICTSAFDPDGEFVSRGLSGPTGLYGIGGLPSGNFRIEFSDCSNPHGYATEYYDDKPNLAKSDPVAVTAGGLVQNIDAQLDPAGSLSGTVTDLAGTGLDDICIDAFNADGDLVENGQTIPDQGGEFYVPGLSGGSYRVKFYNCSDPDLFGIEYYDNQRSLASATPVVVVPGAMTPNIDAELGPDASPPDTVIDSGPSGTISNSKVTFTFTGSPAEDTARIQCRIDGAAFADCSSPKIFSGLDNGSHTAEFRAEDALGNQDPTPAIRTFKVNVIAKVSKVTVKGPAKVKKGKKATYSVKITNSGKATATEVRLKVSGRGISFNTPVGTIAPGKTRTVKIKVKPKKPGKIKATFKVTSKNAGGKTVRKSIRVTR